MIPRSVDRTALAALVLAAVVACGCTDSPPTVVRGPTGGGGPSPSQGTMGALDIALAVPAQLPDRHRQLPAHEHRLQQVGEPRRLADHDDLRRARRNSGGKRLHAGVDRDRHGQQVHRMRWLGPGHRGRRSDHAGQRRHGLPSSAVGEGDASHVPVPMSAVVLLAVALLAAGSATTDAAARAGRCRPRVTRYLIASSSMSNTSMPAGAPGRGELS